MAFHGPSYGLDAELEAKRKASYDPNLEREAKEWIEAVVGKKITPDFATGLKDGIILCEFINVIKPGSCPKPNASKMPFKQMENIGNFLTACGRLGQAPIDMFQTVDLFEAKNMNQVVHHIHALGRIAQRIGFRGPTIGVKLADGHVSFSHNTFSFLVNKLT
eukprot:TRINITY_DN1770_c0_g1_i2.p1 TRINITY_DN1770_c0_g1~~TRINITY_DN1770_c0_g1_i2.p1  ORF type:complete len:162 (+),score=49.27 TRINITY_DN1770_c0_g1_i2:70-555(+)